MQVLNKSMIESFYQQLLVSQEPELMKMFVEVALENSSDVCHDMAIDHGQLPESSNLSDFALDFTKDMLDEFFKSFKDKLGETKFAIRPKIQAKLIFE